jgi:hypothetical protein
VLPLLLLSACLVPQSLVDAYVDRDDDGDPHVAYEGGTDCDDDDPERNRTLEERCGDGVDNDCDGQVDEDGDGALPTFRDADGDGYGRGAAIPRCDLVEGWSLLDGDCDDAADDVHPDATETCGDGVDDDCDGLVDNGDPNTPWFLDDDGDGYGGDAGPLQCQAVPGHALARDDCDDADPDVHPGAVDVRYDGVDADCALDDDFDHDGDG